MRRYFLSHGHGDSRFCISLLAFANLARGTVSKLTRLLGCRLVSQHAQTGVQGALTFNTLPEEIRSLGTKMSFKRALIMHSLGHLIFDALGNYQSIVVFAQYSLCSVM